MKHSLSGFLALVAFCSLVGWTSPHTLQLPTPSSTGYASRYACGGTATSGGGTFTCDLTPTIDRVSYVTAHVLASHVNAAHLADALSLTCSASVANKNGTLSFPGAVSGSSNPSTVAAAYAQGEDANWISGGGSPSTCAFSIVGGALRLTFTDQGSVSADDVQVIEEVTEAGAQ